MENPSWSWLSDWRIPSRHGAGKPIEEEILGQLREHGWVDRDVFAVHLALEEALVNAIIHGNGLCSTKWVSVDCKISSERLWIRIADEGTGFCPGNVPDPTDPENLERPCGRGIMLMRNFMSRVDYNAEGNCVEMEKHRAE
ncbi:MAG: ATP-binding protein [Planctomycetes bacterium]|nr:ATP-binding protein [Planctomycetota bacterium]